MPFRRYKPTQGPIFTEITQYGTSNRASSGHGGRVHRTSRGVPGRRRLRTPFPVRGEEDLPAYDFGRLGHGVRRGVGRAPLSLACATPRVAGASSSEMRCGWHGCEGPRRRRAGGALHCNSTSPPTSERRKPLRCVPTGTRRYPRNRRTFTAPWHSQAIARRQSRHLQP